MGGVGLTRAGYVGQARCALLAVRALLDRLRTLDLYDRSAIVVTSDLRPDGRQERAVPGASDRHVGG